METSTHERGRFYIGPNGFPRFAGSASGVYLADTVRSDLTSTTSTDHPTPDPGIEDAFIHRNNDEPRSDETALYSIYLLRSKDLLDEEGLRLRLNRYFTIWHPLFPFLDGAYLLQCFNNSLQLAKLHHEPDSSQVRAPGDGTLDPEHQLAFDGLTPEQSLALTTIFLAIFTIGGLGIETSEDVSKIPAIHSSSQATMLGHLVVGACQNSRVDDLFGIQALLALELLFYVTRKYRPAMHLSGVLTKLAYEAGLHRCPERYASTFVQPADRDLRKRVFYSLYILDRLLSADFGIPIMLSDSDIDTCVPGGEEKHAIPDHGPGLPSPYFPSSGNEGARGTKRKFPAAVSEDTIRAAPTNPQIAQNHIRLLPAYSLSLMAQMIGQAMEQFNKSVSHRAINANEVLHLRSTLDAWWNDIGLDSDDDAENPGSSPDPRRKLSTLFTCLYHSQIINLNRPALSLPPSQVQHDHALQAAIGSVRVICSTLSSAFFKNKEELYWPGYVDMVFLGSLILVYGARRERARRNAAAWLLRDLRRALSILEHLAKRWPKSDKFGRVVKALIEREEPNLSEQSHTVSWELPMLPAQPDVQPSESTQGPNFNLADCFHFDFDTFVLEPESTWAYHVSMPPSPNL
uniref:Xylanolytic transcriptional activator regulatory domain-containing protein n=1 Tax=Kwoniella dejecticola CBS 10117 TaxID=1296121 RepID=A0A1A6AB50_9TREE|nr:uncharacterized protein I303_01489 [Kwoniella dejecticola CBS 10117]OBR87287.1 hypothetical protein I303_01489 [Kwoniella dejecticola CBS 10117]